MRKVGVRVGGALRHLRVSRTGVGSEQPVILLHHGTGSLRSWDLFAPRLPSVSIAYDRLGFGGSTPLTHTWGASYHTEGADELLRLCDALHIERAAIVGHSDGATIALLAAAAQPSRIEAIVAEAPHVWHGSRHGGDGGFAAFHARYSHDARFARAMERDHGPDWRKVYTRWYEWWTSNNGWDVSEVLQRVQCPVLVVHGAEDIFFPVEHSEHIAAGCARGELAVIRDAGHEVHREAPDEFADLALRFLSRGGRCTTTSATA